MGIICLDCTEPTIFNSHCFLWEIIIPRDTFSLEQLDKKAWHSSVKCEGITQASKPSMCSLPGIWVLSRERMRPKRFAFRPDSYGQETIWAPSFLNPMHAAFKSVSSSYPFNKLFLHKLEPVSVAYNSRIFIIIARWQNRLRKVGHTAKKWWRVKTHAVWF